MWNNVIFHEMTTYTGKKVNLRTVPENLRAVPAANRWYEIDETALWEAHHHITRVCGFHQRLPLLVHERDKNVQISSDFHSPNLLLYKIVWD